MPYDRCPFCGSGDIDEDEPLAIIQCLRCSAIGPGPTSEENWNDRTPGPATAKMLELMRRELADYLDGLAPEARDEEDVKIVRAFLEEWGR